MSQNVTKVFYLCVIKLFIMTKKCSKCKQDKELSEFTKNKNGKLGVHHYCKVCNYEQKKNTYDYSKSRNKRILSSYKIDISTVEAMYISQNKRCKICNKEYSTVSKHGGLYIDHCHATGEVRGLLCSSCNNLLGQCKDDINILKNAIKYLQIFTIFGA